MTLDNTNDQWQILSDLVTPEYEELLHRLEDTDGGDAKQLARLIALRRKLEAASGVIGGAA